MEDEQKEQINNRPWLYKKGQSGNPKGRPPGTFSLKEYVKKKLAAMTDEEREDYLDSLPKADIWRMGEGNPDNKTNVKVETKEFTNEELELAKKIIEQRLSNTTIETSVREVETE